MFLTSNQQFHQQQEFYRQIETNNEIRRHCIDFFGYILPIKPLRNDPDAIAFVELMTEKYSRAFEELSIHLFEVSKTFRHELLQHHIDLFGQASVNSGHPDAVAFVDLMTEFYGEDATHDAISVVVMRSP